MLVKLDLKKSSMSTWMTAAFALVLFMTGFYSDFFQAPLKVNKEISRYRSLFQPGQILGVRELILKNNMGTFHFEKSATDPDTPWTMVSPRKLPANSSLVKNILQELNNVQIRAVHNNDPINIANYSLDSTSLEVTLIDSNEKNSTLKFGLVNPLDNSTYVSFQEQDAIYHINNISTSLNSLDLSKFVDTRIFTFDLGSVASFKIYRGPIENNQVSFQALKSKDGWHGKRNYTLKPEAIKEYMGVLSELTSSIIIDRMNEKLQEEVKTYLNKPFYTIEVIDSQNNSYKYIVSSLVKNLHGLKLEKWQNFIIQPSNREFPYILNKKYLDLFQGSEKRIRNFPIKKLFY